MTFRASPPHQHTTRRGPNNRMYIQRFLWRKSPYTYPWGDSPWNKVNKPYKYVPPQRARFLRRFGLKTGIDFARCGKFEMDSRDRAWKRVWKITFLVWNSGNRVRIWEPSGTLAPKFPGISPRVPTKYLREITYYIKRNLVQISRQQLPTDPWNSHGNNDGRCFC